jgi:hypothetical protein
VLNWLAMPHRIPLLLVVCANGAVLAGAGWIVGAALIVASAVLMAVGLTWSPLERLAVRHERRRPTAS